jgi:hypothetical protein
MGQLNITGGFMKAIFGKKQTIFDKLADAVADCAIDDKEIIKEFHLEEDEFKEYIRVMSGLGSYIGPSDKKYYFQGIEVKKVPKYDLFHNGDYWIKHNFDLDEQLTSAGVDITHQGPFMIYHGQAYRKVSNLAGDPAPVKNRSGRPYPDLGLIKRLQDEFVDVSLTIDEAVDLIKHQSQHILNLETEKKNRFRMGTT